MAAGGTKVASLAAIDFDIASLKSNVEGILLLQFQCLIFVAFFLKEWLGFRLKISNPSAV